MNRVFFLAIVFIFLAVFVEFVNLVLQLKGRKLNRWFGKDAFKFHMTITLILWTIAFFLIAILQFQKQPLFHNIIVLKYIGMVMVISGLIVSVWALVLLGLRRSLCLNFFEDNVPVVTKSLYKYCENPMDYGFWIALIGFALFTGSIFNLVIAVEFIIVMIPHLMLENIPLKK
jgi:protein-S-isoprenylcysteine O-methyltransferase Ste14